MTFVDRFDANSYLYLSRAMDYFDLAADHGGRLADAFKGTKTRFCVVSFTSDWHFPTEESRALVHALNASGASVSFVEIETDRGHDAFLLDEPELFAAINGFLGSAARAKGTRTAAMSVNGNQSRRPSSRRRPHRARARVLDVGCGDGILLEMLQAEKEIDGRGVEISQRGVNECVARGLSVIQGDADTDLGFYPDKGFDFVILSQTLQATRNPKLVLERTPAHRRPRDRLVPEFRPLAGAAVAVVPGPHAGDHGTALRLVRHAQYSLLHHPRLRHAVRRDRREGGKRRPRSTPTARRSACRCHGGSGTFSASRRCFC